MRLIDLSPPLTTQESEEEFNALLAEVENGSNEALKPLVDYPRFGTPIINAARKSREKQKANADVVARGELFANQLKSVVVKLSVASSSTQLWHSMRAWPTFPYKKLKH